MGTWPSRLEESQMRQSSMITGSEQLGPLSDYTANCRLVLSSERAPHRNKTTNFRQQQTCALIPHLEHHHYLESCRRRRKGYPVPMGITGKPCSRVYKYGDLALQVGKALNLR
jgi:hypothetical protein